MQQAARKTILRIELWQAALLAALLVGFGRSSWLDPLALLAGGIFMAINFLLLSFGVAWVLTPLAVKGRRNAGLVLLAFKIALFLGILSLAFFRFDLDAVSFALGFSTLLVAIVGETVFRAVKFGI